MNRFFVIFFTFFIWGSTYAHDFYVDGIYYQIMSPTKQIAAVTHKTGEYNSYSGDIVIPETVTYNDTVYSVKSIELEAFALSEGLTSIIIPNSIDTIAPFAFFDCSNLALITIPNTTKYIGAAAFKGCKNITSINLPDSIRSIEGFMFSSCTNLKNIKIPNTVTHILTGAFEDCI